MDPLVAMVVDRLRSHHEKQPFRSEQTALRMAWQMFNKHGVVLDVYKCRWCKRWHIGHGFGSARKSARLDAFEMAATRR